MDVTLQASISFDRVDLRLAGQDILKQTSFDVLANEVTCILGASGCGKSTALRMIGDLLRPDAGDIRVLGQEPQNARDQIAYVFQSPRLLPWRTVAENITIALKLRHVKLSRAERRTLAERELQKVGLFDERDRMPDSLSGGQRQRVALARALALDPAVLLLDEPFSALDIGTRVKLRMDLAEITDRDRKTVVLVTHDIDDALSLADRVLVLAARPARVVEDIRIDRSQFARGDIAAVPPSVRQAIEDHFAQ